MMFDKLLASHALETKTKAAIQMSTLFLLGKTATQLPSSYLVVCGAEAGAFLTCSRSHNKAHNETVQAQGLGEDENKDHANEEPRLLRVCPDACITNNANGKASSKGGEADGEAGAEVS